MFTWTLRSPSRRWIFRLIFVQLSLICSCLFFLFLSERTYCMNTGLHQQNRGQLECSWFTFPLSLNIIVCLGYNNNQLKREAVKSQSPHPQGWEATHEYNPWKLWLKLTGKNCCSGSLCQLKVMGNKTMKQTRQKKDSWGMTAGSL